MKTITMNYSEYKEELKAAQDLGYNNANQVIVDANKLGIIEFNDLKDIVDLIYDVKAKNAEREFRNYMVYGK